MWILRHKVLKKALALTRSVNLSVTPFQSLFIAFTTKVYLGPFESLRLFTLVKPFLFLCNKTFHNLTIWLMVATKVHFQLNLKPLLYFIGLNRGWGFFYISLDFRSLENTCSYWKVFLWSNNQTFQAEKK